MTVEEMTSSRVAVVDVIVITLSRPVFQIVNWTGESQWFEG